MAETPLKVEVAKEEGVANFRRSYKYKKEILEAICGGVVGGVHQTPLGDTDGTTGARCVSGGDFVYPQKLGSCSPHDTMI